MNEHTSFAIAAVAVYVSSAAVAIASLHYGVTWVAAMAVLGALAVRIEAGEDEDSA